MNSIIKYILLWAMSGVIGMYLVYGAVKYVGRTVYITKDHIINGAIFGPFTLVLGIGGWVEILLAEAKNWWEND